MVGEGEESVGNVKGGGWSEAVYREGACAKVSALKVKTK